MQKNVVLQLIILAVLLNNYKKTEEPCLFKEMVFTYSRYQRG